MLVSFCLSPSTVALMMLMCRCCSDTVFFHFSVWNFWTSLLSVLNCWCLSPSTVALIVSPVPFLLSMYYATNTLHWRCSVVPTVGDIFLLLNLWRHITSRRRHVSSFKLFPYLGLYIYWAYLSFLVYIGHSYNFNIFIGHTHTSDQKMWNVLLKLQPVFNNGQMYEIISMTNEYIKIITMPNIYHKW